MESAIDYYPDKLEKIAREIKSKVINYSPDWYGFKDWHLPKSPLVYVNNVNIQSLTLAKYLRKKYKDLFQIREFKPSIEIWNKIVYELANNQRNIININKAIFTRYNLVYIPEPCNNQYWGILIFVDTGIDYKFVSGDNIIFPDSWYEFMERMSLLPEAIRYLYKLKYSNNMFFDVGYSWKRWPYTSLKLEKIG